jgi:hypothetical protein
MVYMQKDGKTERKEAPGILRLVEMNGFPGFVESKTITPVCPGDVNRI